jgi:hypothetical protein
VTSAFDSSDNVRDQSMIKMHGEQMASRYFAQPGNDVLSPAKTKF